MTTDKKKVKNSKEIVEKETMPLASKSSDSSFKKKTDKNKQRETSQKENAQEAVTFTIQQAADQLGLSTKTLRRWEEKGIIKAQRTAGNQRRYTLLDVERLQPRVKKLSSQQFSNIAEIRNPNSQLYLESSFSNESNPINSNVERVNSPPFSKNTTRRTFGADPKVGTNNSYVQVSRVGQDDNVQDLKISHKSKFKQSTALLGVFAIVIISMIFLSSPHIAGETNRRIFSVLIGSLNKEQGDYQSNVLSPGVLSDTIKLKGMKGEISFNIPAIFNSNLRVNGDTLLNGNATVSGTLTAPNIVYSVIPGQNISISGDPQNPTISTGPIVTSFAGKTGDLKLSAGTGINVSDLEISMKNTSLTVEAGSGLSGGGKVELGGSISLENAGVISLAGTANQVLVSVSTGDVTLSLPQDIDLSSSPTFSSINLTSNTNQLVLGSGNTGTLTLGTLTADRTYTLPDLNASNDTICLAALANCSGGSGGIGGAGTINRVAKFTASNLIGNSSINDLGSAVAMTIDASGNVGIGTTTPTSFKLEVAGNVGPEADNTRDLGSASKRWANIYGTNVIASNLSGAITPTGFTPGSVVFAGSGGTLTQDNANFFWDDTNNRLGIGITTPTSSLVVQGITGNSTAEFITTENANRRLVEIRNYSNGTAGATRLGIINDAGTGMDITAYGSGNTGTFAGLSLANTVRVSSSTALVLYAAGANPMIFATNNTERMRIDSAGNVGIGTTAPTHPLHVVGTAIKTERFGGTPQFIASRSNGTSASPTIVSNASTLFALTGQGYDGANYQNAAQILFEVDNTPGIGDMPGRISFFTTPDGSSTPLARMRIDSNGNVGIGTTTPTSFKLEIAGNIGPEADNTRDLGSASRRWANIYATNITGAVTPTGFTQGSVAFAGSGGTLSQDNANFFWDDTNNHLNIGTTNTTAGGSLIFGASVANISMDTVNGADNKRLQLSSGGNDGSVTRGAYINLFGNETASQPGYLSLLAGEGGDITFYAQPVGSLLERVRITSAGNVGIGTTSPAAVLHTASDTNGSVLFSQASNDASTANVIIRKSRGTHAVPLDVQSSDALAIFGGPVTLAALPASCSIEGGG